MTMARWHVEGQDKRRGKQGAVPPSRTYYVHAVVSGQTFIIEKHFYVRKKYDEKIRLLVNHGPSICLELPQAKHSHNNFSLSLLPATRQRQPPAASIIILCFGGEECKSNPCIITTLISVAAFGWIFSWCNRLTLVCPAGQWARWRRVMGLNAGGSIGVVVIKNNWLP